MKSKALFTVVNILLIIALIAVITVAVLAETQGASGKLAGDNYLKSENLAASAEVSGDIRSPKKITDGKNSSSATLTRRADAEVTFDLGAEKDINTVLLKEDGLNCKSFEIIASSDGINYRTVHKSDKIEYHRLCTFPTTKARYVRLRIVEATDNVTLREVAIHNEPVRDAANFRVSGYYADNWHSTVAMDETLTETDKIAQLDELIRMYNFDNLTNIFMYCGVSFDALGNVFLSADDTNVERKAALKFTLDQIRIQSKRDVKLSMVFGASTGDQTFLTAISTNKINFIKNIIVFANELGFDGVDIDYEFPQTDSDYAAFDSFLIDLKAEMLKGIGSNALLSCAFGTRDIDYTEKARNALDFVNCMTYDIFDQDGQHSSYWGGAVQGARYLESVGFTKEQISIGIPFYGTQEDALMEQYIYKNLTYHDYYNNYYTVPDYLGKPTQVYFNSPSIARDKTAFAMLAGYGGIMVWSATIDIDVANENSLWRAINDAVNVYGGVL